MTFFNESYIGQRGDVLKLIPPHVKNVLDIGCSTGVLGAAIKEKTKARVVGIDISKEMAKIASQKIDEVIIGDIESADIQNKLEGMKFDAIILADVLEHLRDPWSLLSKITNNLCPRGVVVASIPNVRHIDTIINLVIKGHWPYRKRGIHDQAHLRFFTKKNIIELFKGANLKIEKVEVHYRLIETLHYLNRFARYFAFPGLRDFIAFQYLILARNTNH